MQPGSTRRSLLRLEIAQNKRGFVVSYAEGADAVTDRIAEVIVIRKHVDAAAAGHVGELSRNLFGGEYGEAVARGDSAKLLETGLQCAGEDSGAFHVHRRRFLMIKNVKAQNA